jgi:hypothetical protein
MKPYKELSANEKLDAVLDFFYSKKLPTKFDGVYTDFGLTTMNDVEYRVEIVFIVNQLCEVDKYIFDSKDSTYAITFAGKIFKENGGYKAKANAEVAAYEKDKAQLKRLEDVDTATLKNQATLNGLTNKLIKAGWAAAIAAFLYLSWLIYSYGLDKHYWYVAHWLSKTIKHILAIFS